MPTKETPGGGPPNPSVVLYGGTLAATTTAAAVGSDQRISEILVQNDPNNGVDILVGGSATQPIRLQPGQTLVLPVGNVNVVYAKTVSGTGTVNWLGRN